LDLLKDEDSSNEVRKLLYECQKGVYKAYMTNLELYILVKQTSGSIMYRTVSILKDFIDLIDVNCVALTKAGKEGDFEDGLYRILYKKYGINFVASKRKNKSIDSTIRVMDPKDLRKILENGETD